MKKTFLTLVLVTGLTGAAHAQRSDVSLGLKAGVSYASFAGKQTSNLEGLFGFHVGGFANIGITKLIAFQPEVIYSQKGTKYKDLTDLTARQNYLDVPLSFHVNADGLFFEAGPQIGFLLSAKSEAGNTSVDVKNTVNAIDFGYLAGLGYQRKIGPGIGLRYNGAFTNFPKSYTRGNVTVQDKVRNSVFQLYVTYSFGG